MRKGGDMERLTEKDLLDGHINKRGVLVADCLNKLGQYEDLEEQGLLLRLPCKIGDTVYSVVEDGLQIVELEFTLDFYVRRKANFGKTIFLTKEEAEQALAEMKEV